ncbi:MAG: L-alanine-DL-glutamate epimerase [Verrucomicrobia bacterium]|nr:L-alanine-DL-glutamate epimerase [Verrucomicrobiota bacterium]
MIQLKRTNLAFERELFVSPFGFKGGYIREAWQTVALMESCNAKVGLGLGTQSTLWSDAAVFMANPEAAGNAVMFLMTAFALRAAEKRGFDHPMTLLDELLPATYKYGQTITGYRNLRPTFALNALVAVDNAAWMLYAAENGLRTFDEMIPADYRKALAHRHREVASIPLMSYGVPQADIAKAVADGYFFIKIKIGADPDKDGDLDKMLAWDKQRLTAIHKAIGHSEIRYTDNHRIPYYLDANGRYDSKDRLLRLLDHAGKIGALDRIMILEEPFPEEYRVDVRDIPARLAADESAHSDRDARERIEMGYRAIALKPIAKTLSMSLKIARLAHEQNVPCFCADLTVNPILVDWNKNVAARLAPLPGMRIGALETNGHQNYKNWGLMKSYHPRAGAPWMETTRGLFHLDDGFYAASGGILEPSQHYLELVKG